MSVRLARWSYDPKLTSRPSARDSRATVQAAMTTAAFVFLLIALLGCWLRPGAVHRKLLSFGLCGELVATCQMSEGYGALTYMICAAVVAVLWRTLGSDSDDNEPPETMYN